MRGVRVRFAAVLLAILLTACASPEKPALPAKPVSQAIPLPADGHIIVNAREYPWSAVGRINAGGRGYCTGVLVSARHVLASAPCLYNRIEGRWWHHSEVHYVAGYQRDTYLANSPVESYRRAPGYDPSAGPTLGNVTRNWALLVLRDPIGRHTGWLGLQALDQGLRRRLALGEAQVLPVGYRRGRPHAVVLNLGCSLSGPIPTTSAPSADCEVSPRDVAMPPLVFADGNLRAASGQLSGDGRGSLAEVLRRAGISFGTGQAPQPGRAALDLPLATIDFFLIHLGYLAPAAEGLMRALDRDERATAIRDFQSRNGLPADGRPSVSLLGYLIWAAQPAPAVS